MKKKNIIVSIMSVVLLTNITLSVSADNNNVIDLPEEIDITEEDNAEVSIEEENAEDNDEVEVTVENDEEETTSEENDFSDEETDLSEDFSDNGNFSVQTNGKMVGGYIPSSADYNVPVYDSGISTYSNLPVSYPGDMTSFYNKYPGNRNQNPYGTCWAFSSIGLAEFDLINDGYFDKSIDLSELQLAYFTFNSVKDPLGGTEGDHAKYYNENTTTSYLNYGGNYEMAARRLSQWVGSTSEADVPYKGAAGTLANGLNENYAYNHDVAHLRNAYIINLKSNVDAVKQNIMEHGAVGTMYYHDDSSMLWNSESSLWTYYDTSNAGGGHAVMIVGWDDDFSTDNFVGTSKPKNNGAWLIRNSWGMYCNYFWMSYESTSLAESAWVFDFDRTEQYDNNYQYDGGLNSYPSSYRTLSNIFSVTEKDGVESETLDAVSISCMQVSGVNYTVEIYTDLENKNDPTSGKRQDEATTVGTTAYAGIYTIPLENPVYLTPGSDFSVVITLDQAALDYEQAIRIEDFDNNKVIWDCAVSMGNAKSFYKTGNRFYQWYWGNFCIKAFTVNNVETPVQEHSISYVLQGGTNHQDNPESYKSQNTELELHEPTRDGYRFIGWFLDEEYKQKISHIPANSNQDYILYACWELAPKEVTNGQPGIYEAGDGKWYYFKDDIIQNNITDVIESKNGLRGWYYVKSGKLQTGQTTVEQNKNGWWYIDKNGKVDFTFTGIAKNRYGSWYCKKGQVQFGTTSVIESQSEYNGWYYVKKGKLQTGQTTVEQNNNGWWYIDKDGKVDFSFTGIAKNRYGSWYCKKGQVQFGMTSVVESKGDYNGWYYVKKGELQIGQKTVEQNAYGWWYIDKNGKVDFSFTGIAANQHGEWYIENGKVDFKKNLIQYTDPYTGVKYEIVEGKATKLSTNNSNTLNLLNVLQNENITYSILEEMKRVTN